MKHSTIAAIALLAIFTACSGDADRQGAEAMLNSIDSAMSTGDYQTAIRLIDSLNATYPRQIEIRKSTDSLRLISIEGLTQQQIPDADADIARCRVAIDSLLPLFVQQKPAASLPEYLLYNTLSKTAFADKPCIQPRVNTGQDADDTPWIVAVNAGRDIGLSAVTFIMSDGTEYQTKLYSGDGAVGTIQPEAMQSVVDAIEGGATIASITATGDKSTVKITPQPTISTAIATSATLANYRSALREALYKRERLERLLQLTHDKQANLPGK